MVIIEFFFQFSVSDPSPHQQPQICICQTLYSICSIWSAPTCGNMYSFELPKNASSLPTQEAANRVPVSKRFQPTAQLARTSESLSLVKHAARWFEPNEDWKEESRSLPGSTASLLQANWSFRLCVSVSSSNPFLPLPRQQ